ncbi:MAG: glycosyltransferase family 4 protein [Acidobacteria bacterium]|nr:glycosyltransferase family 4 protein [Acidobacteriota bacterium]
MTPPGLRIGVDVRYLSHRLVGGVHTYVARLLPALLDAASGHTFVLYADDKAPLELTDTAGALVRTLRWRHQGSSVWNDHMLARSMAADGIDVAFFPANYGFGPRRAATVVTVHDAINLLPLRHTLVVRGHAATLRTSAMTVYLHVTTRQAVRRATRLIALSSYARDTIVAASTRRSDDIDVVPHGTPPAAAVTPADIERVRRAHGLTGAYVLADGLKNPGVLLRAAARLSPDVRRAHTFVFFARHAQVLPVLASAAAAGEARLLVNPSRSDLAALYAGASAFVFPSWIEGFGLPLLEAMSYGTPIIASDRGAIPEVAGDAAILVDAEDDPRLAQALHDVLMRPETAAALRAAGAARGRQFTWRRSAEQTLEALQRAHAMHTGAGRAAP